MSIYQIGSSRQTIEIMNVALRFILKQNNIFRKLGVSKFDENKCKIKEPSSFHIFEILVTYAESQSDCFKSRGCRMSPVLLYKEFPRENAMIMKY